MKPSFLVSLTLFFTLMGTTWSTQSTPDSGKPELWNRAVSTYSLSRELIPGRLHISFSMLSSKGEVTEGHEREVRYFMDEKTGKLQSEILWAREKGKDITEKARTEQKKQQKAAEKSNAKKRSISLGHDDLPFAMSRQPDVTVRLTTQRKTLEGHNCQGFDFTMKVPPKKEDEEATLIKGRAWIDEKMGLPMELTFTPDPLPSKVKSMNSAYTFEADSQGRWVVKSFTMEGSGGFLFIKKYFRSHIIMSDYFSKPAQ